MAGAEASWRILRHLATPHWIAHRRFPGTVLAAIERAVRAAERDHAGEIRFAVEAHLGLAALWHGVSARQRAQQLFGELGVWDTEANNGVLIYVLLADRRVEIIADRGIGARVPTQEWLAACRLMQDQFRAGRYEEGAVAGIRAAAALIGRHFPGAHADKDELPDKPVVL